MPSSLYDKTKQLQPEKPYRRADVSDLILDYILEKKLGVGDKLPTEQELVRRFGLSRIRIREGIQGLKYLGILSAATRGGTTIQSLNFSQLGRTVRFQIAINHVDWRHLLEARFAIERAVLENLSGRLTAAQLEELRGYANCKLTAKTQEEMRLSNVRDMQFHMKLAEATGNPVFAAYQGILHCFFENNPIFLLAIDSTPTDEHLQLLQALAENNPALACGILRRHLDRYYNRTTPLANRLDLVTPKNKENPTP